ncbi:MAG: sulfurtransferase TusA family protein [Pseudorhodoplanes sp.]
MADQTIDLRGLKCPLPVLVTGKRLASLAAGDMLTVECTDPLAAIDIPNLLRQTGDTLESTAHRNGLLVFRICKTAKDTR